MGRKRHAPLAFRFLLVIACVTAAVLGSRAASAQALNWLLPAGGETWTAGTTHTVEWSGGSANNVNVLLVQLSPFQFAGTIASNVPNSGYASWAIPGGLTPGGYQLYVEDPSQPTYTYSQTFTIRSAVVCHTGCSAVSASMPVFQPPAGACGTTAAQAQSAAQSYILSQLSSACASGYSVDPTTVLVDVTVLPFGACLAGYSGAFIAEASATGCCCPSATPSQRTTWGRVKSIYR